MPGPGGTTTRPLPAEFGRLDVAPPVSSSAPCLSRHGQILPGAQSVGVALDRPKGRATHSRRPHARTGQRGTARPAPSRRGSSRAPAGPRRRSRVTARRGRAVGSGQARGAPVAVASVIANLANAGPSRIASVQRRCCGGGRASRPARSRSPSCRRRCRTHHGPARARHPDRSGPRPSGRAPVGRCAPRRRSPARRGPTSTSVSLSCGAAGGPGRGTRSREGTAGPARRRARSRSRTPAARLPPAGDPS